MNPDTIIGIYSRNYYFLATKDSLPVKGSEILQQMQIPRIPPDAIITIDSASRYTFSGNGDITITGTELMKLLPLAEFDPYIGYGAFGLGVVLGWNLYFINRYRNRASIGLVDLATVLTTITGAALMTFLDHSQLSLGYYGVGLGAGFLLYFLMLVIFSLCSKDEDTKFPRFFLNPPPGNNSMVVKLKDEE